MAYGVGRSAVACRIPWPGHRVICAAPGAGFDLIFCPRVTNEERTALASSGEARASFDEAGIDLGLIRAYLALTPIERLRSLQNAVRAIQKFRRMEASVRK